MIGIFLVVQGVSRLFCSGRDCYSTAVWIFAAFGTATKCVQCGIWFWAVLALRFTQEGSDAAGKMIKECEAANLRLEPEEGVPSCDGSYQIKAGKLIFAWVIISVLMGK